jgi:hypothetical protein
MRAFVRARANRMQRGHVAFPSPDPHLGHSARETRSACPDEDYLLQVSLTIFRLVMLRSEYSSLLDALITPSRFSSAFSCALDSWVRGPVR